MKYDLTEPCGLCPFRNDEGRLFVAPEILEGFASGEFACHKTCTDEPDEDDEEGNIFENSDRSSQHCAGALIMLEHMGQPHQMMRFAERLGGLYDRRKLNMDSPVFESLDEAMEAEPIQ